MFQASKIQQFGWDLVKVRNPNNLEKILLSIAYELGQPVPHRNSKNLIQKLIPTYAPIAHPNSLSSRFSVGSFPIHIDTSHWPTPCRYFLLGCSNEGIGNRKTKLLDFHALSFSAHEQDFLLNTPFKIVNGKNSFYSSILSTHRDFIRYDYGCMESATKEGDEVFKFLAAERWKGKIIKIKWKAGYILILDNWRVLHGRCRALRNDFDRCLHRILVV